MSKLLLDFISGPESGGNYNAYYGKSDNTEVRLTEMPLREVLAFQKQLAAKTGSSAAGRYQFLHDTLSGLMQEQGVSPDAIFTEALQDQFGHALLERRGLKKFQSGEMSLEDFGNSLAAEWAGVPLVSGPNRGKSRYDGDSMGNSAGVSADDFVAQLGALRGQAYVPPAPAPLTFSQGTQQVPYEVQSPAHIQQNVPLTNAERREQEQDGDRADLWTLTQDAISEGWSASWLLGDSAPMAPDPEFRFTEESFREATKDIPEQYWDRLSQAHSADHLAHIRSQLTEELERSQRLSEAGPIGLSLRLAAGFTDPLAWAAGAGVSLVSSGAGLPAVLAAKFGRMGLVAEGAMAGMIGNTLSDSIIESRSEVMQPADLLWSAGLGAAFGGAFGAIARNPHTAAEARAIERAGKSLMGSTALTGDSSAGAMAHSARQDLRASTTDFLRDGDEAAPEAFAGTFRFDLAGQLKSSDNLLTRMLGNVLVEDGTRNVDGVTPIGASEIQTLMDRKVQIKWRKGFDGAWREFVRRNKIPFGQRDQALRAFSADVVAYARNRDPMAEFDPAVARAGSTFREIMNGFAELANDPGRLTGTIRRPVRGAEAMKVEAYVPRIFDHGSIQDKLMRFGHAALTEFFSKAIKAAAPNLADDVAKRFATGYLNRMHSLSAGELLGAQRAFSGEDLDELRTFLQGTNDISAEDIDAVVEAFSPKPQDGAAPRQKHRQLMDENFVMVIPRRDGAGAENLRVSDFFVNDADFLLTSYSRQMSGRIAMANVGVRNPKWQTGDEAPEYLIDGITSDGEWQTLLDEVKSVADSTGGLKGLTKDHENLQFVYNSIIGRPNFDEGSTSSQLMRMLRDYNFLRVMNQVGFAQLSEIANATSQLGWKALLGNMPSLRSLWRDAKTGQLDDALAQEIEDVIGTGTDWLRHNTMTRMDEFGNPLGGITDSGLFQATDRALQKGKKVTAAISGMAPVNTLLQRWTGRAIFQKLATDARKGTKASKRMLALGLDQAMLDRVQAQIRNHATFKGGKLRAMNWKAWDDHEAMAAFEHAAFRLSRSIIQENDLGQMNKFMSSPLMRTLLQFRSFQTAAWSKQLLQGLNMRDMQTFTGFTTSVFVAGLAYMVRTAANSVGREDQQAYLADRLSLGKLAGASLQNSSWFSLLAPAIDTPWTFLGNESLFTGRNTQLQSNIWTGNPSVDLGLNFLGSGRRLRAFIQGDASQLDARSLAVLLPFQNAVGISNLFSAMISDLPE